MNVRSGCESEQHCLWIGNQEGTGIRILAEGRGDHASEHQRGQQDHSETEGHQAGSHGSVVIPARLRRAEQVRILRKVVSQAEVAGYQYDGADSDPDQDVYHFDPPAVARLFP